MFVDKLLREDLVAEGIDFHCDWNLIKTVVQQHKDQLNLLFIQSMEDDHGDKEPEGYSAMSEETSSDYNRRGKATTVHQNFDDWADENLKKAIWLFRSSCNSHKVVWYLSAGQKLLYEQSKRSELEAKESLLAIWRIVGSSVGNYCRNRVIHYRI